MNADIIDHRRVKSGDVELHCATCGDEAAPLIVLLHGFPAGWSSWRGQLHALARAGFFAVAPDLRGAGQSDKPAGVEPYRMARFVDDVAAIAAAFGKETIGLVGHDIGGGITWGTVMRKPELVRRFAILNSVHPVGYARQVRRWSQMKKSWYVFLFQLPGVPEWLGRRDDFKLIRDAYAGDQLPAETANELLASVTAPGALPAMINWYRAIFRDGMAKGARPPKVSIPSLVIWGDQERYLDPELATPPADYVSNTRTVHVPEASHWVQLDAPERVSSLLIDHFRAS